LVIWEIASRLNVLGLPPHIKSSSSIMDLRLIMSFIVPKNLSVEIKGHQQHNHKKMVGLFKAGGNLLCKLRWLVTMVDIP
jgi:presenilin-like A22 family membrane protease